MTIHKSDKVSHLFLINLVQTEKTMDTKEPSKVCEKICVLSKVKQ